MQRRTLSASDLPTGWKAAPADVDAATLADTPCLSHLGSHPKGLTYTVHSFVEGSGLPSFAEVLAAGPHVRQTWSSAARALARCQTVRIQVAGKRVTSSVRRISFPRIGTSSSAYAWAFSVSGIQVDLDLVLFTVGRYGGELIYIDLGAPQTATVTAFARAAAGKAQDRPSAHVAGAVSVASAPVRTAATTDGKVAYRMLGAGPPLILIMGYGGTMDVWDRRFIDALAQRYRVVIFDNAGIGGTASVPAPLSIDAMANQTSALIRALRLGRTSVLGWSMGSMIAQALAVLHPTQVRRLVLCATYPGNGATVKPSQQAIDALNSGNPGVVMADLFPADQVSASRSYEAALTAYPAAAAAPAATITAQARAITRWWNGADPAGRRASTIATPTLVADGTLDRLDPTANSRAAARSIPGATLELYRDAGHAFLFQDQATLIPRVESFLDR